MWRCASQISKGGIRQSSRVQDSAVEQAEKARKDEALRKELAVARLQAIRDEVKRHKSPTAAI